VLNRNGRRTGCSNLWTSERVTALRSRHSIPVCSEASRGAEGWLNLTKAAKLVGASARTLRLAALEWVDWFNNRRLLEPIGDVPPAEFEQTHYQQQQSLAAAA
jgi:transposase InsO family protein